MNDAVFAIAFNFYSSVNFIRKYSPIRIKCHQIFAINILKKGILYKHAGIFII